MIAYFKHIHKEFAIKTSSVAILAINITGLLVFLGVLLVTLPRKELMHQCFTYGSYYLVLAMTICWAWVLANTFISQKISIISFFQRHWKGLLCCLLLAGITFVSVPKYFRVLSDETNLLSVAKSMTFNKNVINVTEGGWYYGMFWPSPNNDVEKRPFLFPFFTSLMHTLLGYRVANVFALNFLAFFAALTLLYLLLRETMDEWWCLAALILFSSQPVIALSAASAGFEIFNLVFILASFLSLRLFLHKPDIKSFLVLLLNLFMLANVRYESIVFLIIIVLITSFTGYVRLQFFKQSTLPAILPLFFLPLIWQRTLMLSESDCNLTGGSWLKAFSLQHGMDNLGLFFRYILDAGGQLGFAGVVNGLGLMALVFFIVWIIADPKDRNDEHHAVFLASIFACLSTVFFIVLFYQGGINDHPLNGRLYIPVLTGLSVLPVLLAQRFFSGNQHVRLLALMACVACFIFYHPVAVEDRLTNNLMIIREFRFLDDFLKANAGRNSLVICGRPGQTIVYNYGAISYKTANRQVDTILQQYKNHLYDHIFVVQFISYSDHQPVEDNVIDPRYQLEPVAQTQETGYYFVRISKVRLPE